MARRIDLKARSVQVRTIRRAAGHLSAVLNAAEPGFLATLPRSERPAVAAALGLTAADLDDSLPLEVVSTGLRYLVVPVRAGTLARAGIRFRTAAVLSEAYGEADR